MNAQVQKLAEQAGLFIDINGELWPRAMVAEESVIVYQKFAELIVEDSLGVLIDYLEEIDKEQKTPSFIGMAMTISRIREHFGVT